MKNEFASITTTKGGSAPVLQSVKAQGRLEGLVLSMTLSQVFRNTTRKNMEVTYTFPMAWGSVLLGLEVTLGDKRRSGHVMAKQEAMDRYEEAVQKGDAPVMVQKLQGGLYSVALGSLKPKEEMVIDIRYAQLLRFEQGRVRLTLPTTIAPRYGDAENDGGLSPDQVPMASLLVEYPFELSLDVVGAMAEASISSPSHDVTQQKSAQGVLVQLSRKAWLDRDFLLLLDNLQGKSFALSGPDTLSGEGHAATLASFCPTLAPRDNPSVHVKILVDCSGSMQGDSMNQAKQALGGLTKLLHSHDTFSLSLFGSATTRVLKPMEAGLLGLTRFRIELAKIQANLGGTEMLTALEDTFAIETSHSNEKAQADVLLITDGEVWNAQQMVDMARASGHRIYALGVGSAPAESLLQELAEATGGACEMVSPREDMKQAIERLFSRLRQAQPVDAHFLLPADTLWASPPPKRLAQEETVHLFARTREPLQAAPILTINGTELAATTLQQTSGDLVARLLAAQEIGYASNVPEATAIAQTYQLVTDNTNLLLVFERAEGDKTDGMPELHQVAQMMAAGWGGTGEVCLSASYHSIDPLMAAPTVYRSRRSTGPVVNQRLPDSSFDNFEIPSFLRKQQSEAPEPGSSLTLLSNALDLVHAFNEATKGGQGFRQTLRLLAGYPPAHDILKVIDAIRPITLSTLNAWACLILWAHKRGGGQSALSERSMELVRAQLLNVTLHDQTVAMEAIDQMMTEPTN